MKKIKVGLCFNLKKPGLKDERYEEFDEPETIEAIKNEFEKVGFTVALLEQNDEFVKNLLNEKPDFVFNIAEGLGSTRNRESQIPAILDMFCVPHSGSDALSMGLTLDKYLTNITLDRYNVPVPKAFVFNSPEDLDSIPPLFDDGQSYIIKPRWEGSSKGIFDDSIVFDEFSLKTKVNHILNHYSQPAIAEEFLPGDEITCGVCGNRGSLESLGMMKIVPKVKQQNFIYSIDNKRNWREKIDYIGMNEIPNEVQTRVVENAFKAFNALELRDLSRIDFRLDKNGIPKVIDINPLPGLSPHYSDLIIMYRLRGGGYSELIGKVIAGVRKRLNV